MFGSGYARRKITYNIGRTKRAGPGKGSKFGDNDLFTWGWEDKPLIEKAVVFDRYGPVEFDSPNEFFGSPGYRYMGDYELNGVVTHHFMLIPEDDAEAEELYRKLSLPDPEWEKRNSQNLSG